MALRNSFALNIYWSIVLLAAVSAAAQESTTAAERDKFLTLANSFEIGEPSSDKPVQLVEQPLFSWVNPQRSSNGGVMYLWIQQGRPFATLGIWQVTQPGTNGYELQSLTESQILAKSKRLGNWTAESPGLKYEEISDEQPPRETELQRVRQMRQIIQKRMKATLDPDTDGEETLRLLSTPLFRYKERPTGVIDGAVFAFAQDTDPEVLVIVEAREAKNGPRWFFASAPATSHGLDVTFDRRTIIETKRLVGFGFREGKTFVMRPWTTSTIDDTAP